VKLAYAGVRVALVLGTYKDVYIFLWDISIFSFCFQNTGEPGFTVLRTLKELDDLLHSVERLVSEAAKPERCLLVRSNNLSLR
jgi:hypothetical protein